MLADNLRDWHEILKIKKKKKKNLVNTQFWIKLLPVYF